MTYGSFSIGPGVVHFDAHQQLVQASLTPGQQYKGLTLAGGPDTLATFDAGKQLVGATLGENADYLGYSFKSITPIEFFPGGGVKNATLAKSRRYDNYLIEKGSVSFRENGTVSNVLLAVPLNSPGGIIPAHTPAYLNKSGLLERVLATDDWVLHDIPVGYEQWLDVYPNGQVKSLDTGLDPIGIEGRVYPGHTRLEFAADGTLTLPALLIPDDLTIPPSTPVRHTGTLINAAVSLSWEPSTDDEAVLRYNVYHDNQYFTTVSSPFYTNSANGDESHSWYVVSFDTRSNFSTRSEHIILPDS